MRTIRAPRTALAALRIATLLAIVTLAAGCATPRADLPAPSTAPAAIAAPSPSPSPLPSPSPTVAPTPAPRIALIPVTAFTSPLDDLRTGELREVLVASSLAAAARAEMPGVKVVEVTDADVLPTVRRTAGAIALVPPSAVDPTVKTLSLDGTFYWSKPSAHPLTVAAPSGVAPVAPPRTWELAAAGGIIFGRGVQERVEKYGDPARPFAKVRDLTRAADLAIATLEAPLSGSDNRPCTGCLVFVGNERYVAGIVDAGFDALSLAANHIGDAGPQGVLDSIRVARAAGVVPFGAGPDAASARRAAVVDVAGLRVALVGYDDVPPASYAATESRAGHNHLVHDDPTYAAVRADVSAARAIADVVIVVPHWGIEYEDRPRPWIVEAAHAMLDAGATAVLGDHPHWVQAVEAYPGAYVAFSMGNFVFDQMWSKETRQGSIHRLFFDGPRLVSVRIVPTLLEDFHQPRPMEKGEPAFAETLARILSGSKFGP